MPARKHNKHWSQREKDELAMLWQSMTSTEIATLLDRTVIAVRRQATRMSLDCGPQPMSKPSASEMADLQ